MARSQIEAPAVTIRPALAAMTIGSASRGLEGEVDQLARVLLAAYADTPESTWLIGDRDTRLAIYAAYWPAVVRYGLVNGTVNVAVDQDGAISGTAIWFDTTAEPSEAYDELLTTTCGARASRFRRLNHLLTGHQSDHKSTAAIWRLAWLALQRGRQCRGIGSTLLTHRHTILDSQRSPVLLTATTSGARDLFARQGYVQCRVALRLTPGGRTSVWPMAREPSPPATNQPTRGTPT